MLATLSAPLPVPPSPTAPSPTAPSLTGQTFPSTAMCQSLNIRYELSEHTLELTPDSLSAHSLLSLYWEGRRLAGYRTIEQFYDDMATEGWQIQSISRAHSRQQLHFAVMIREL